MLDLNDLYYFSAVVRHGGFAAAGRALDVPKSNLSRRVARLEQQVGVRLLERSTRRLVVTEIGQEFHGHCLQMIAQAEAAEEATQRMRGEPHGLVRASCPPGLSGQLAHILPSFLAAHPNIRIQLVVSNRRVDLVEERLDIALRARRRIDFDPNLVTKVLGQTRSILMAAPSLLADYPAIEAPDDLTGMPTLGVNEQMGREAWQLNGPAGQEFVLQHDPRMACSDFPMLTAAALEGLGIALIPDSMCEPYLSEGRLVQVLPEWYTDETLLHLVFTSRRGLLPAVRVLVDFLSEELPKVFSNPATRVSPELQ